MMEQNVEVKQSTRTIASYSIANMSFEAYFFIIGTYLYYFWEVEVGLAVWLVALGYAIYAIVNAINDPLVGFLIDKPNRLWKKWGKRFPYMLLFTVPWLLCIYLIFSPPNVSAVTDAMLLFGWLVFSTCLCDTFFSVVACSQAALFPDKFRSQQDRRRVSGYLNLFSLLGTVVGALIPPMIIIYGDRSSFASMALVMIAILLVLFALFIPGIREPKWMRENYLEGGEVKQVENIGFIDTAKRVFRQKNYVVLMVIYLMSDIASACLMASLNYVIVYVLGQSADMLMILMLLYIIGSIASIPIWLKLSQRMNNNKKLLAIACIVNLAFLVPIGLISVLGLFLFLAIFLGVGMTGFKVGLVPLAGDALDEAVVVNNRHIEASFTGFRTFILRFSLVAQSVIFATVHTLTGFNPVPDVQQTPLAVFGIQLHFALIPAIFFAIGIIIFWKWYGLTPEKSQELKAKIKELGL